MEDELKQVGVSRDTALTIGTFDGVHRGHQYVLRCLREEANRRGLATAVVTFHPIPRSVLEPSRPALHLCSVEDRVSLLRAHGIDHVALLTFTREVAQVSARRFVELLRATLRVRLLVVGPDFALGRQREGTPQVLAAFGAELGFDVVVLRPRTADRTYYSSTTAREALAAADLSTVADVLGRPFSVQGVAADRASRQTPSTAVRLTVPAEQALPPDGRYAARARIGGTRFPAVAAVERDRRGRWQTLTLTSYPGEHIADVLGHPVRVELIGRLPGVGLSGSTDHGTCGRCSYLHPTDGSRA